jgi:WD40 repeat protein
MNENDLFSDTLRNGLKKTELERRGNLFKTGAPVTGAVAIGDAVAASFGDGTIRFFRPDLVPTITNAHLGVVLCMETDHDHLLTGGADGRFLRISLNGDVEELANFGTKWVDCVAAKHGLRTCSSGRTAFVWSVGQTKATELEHSSTVGGLAFDAKGKRLAVAHYGGVTIWEQKNHQWESSKLIWQGSHGAVTFSPDGKYIVTAMQENSLHTWRVHDKIDLAMEGYPAKIKNFAWVGDAPHLVTSGSNEAICWPFDGKEGPMNRPPTCVAQHGKNIATCVQALSSERAVFAGFQDGTVLLAELDESKDTVVLRGSTGVEVTAIATTLTQSHLLIGDSKGQILWTPLWA